MNHIFSRRDMMKGLGVATISLGLGGLYSIANADFHKGTEKPIQQGE
jgi:hypothetical protein